MNDLLYFNGVNASTGEYLTPPLPADQLAQIARGETFVPDNLQELQKRGDPDAPHLGVTVDANDLAQTGWGVIFAQDVDPAVRDALRELLEYRKTQANRVKELYREFSYNAGESKNLFLARQGVGPGVVEPDKVPYYLLIVGAPDKIPYNFQYQLDVAYAVGRIHFDSPADYAQYAQSVVRAEKENIARGKHAAFLGVVNPDDFSTQQSANYLVKPLAEKMRALQTDWTYETYLGEEATKAQLETLLRDKTPAFLFTASHGAAFNLGDPRQMKQQGALISTEWQPNAMRGQAIPQTMYYAADDVMSDANVNGMIAFHFACYGAGTPREDKFSHLRQGASTRAQIAPAPFVANLSKKLLAHPKGGALAVIGHIDRAWGSSFVWDKDIAQTGTFENALQKIFEGAPVGAATEFFNNRYAELAASFSSDLEDLKFGKKVDSAALAYLWTANNDARGYAIVGDPAVRLNVNGKKDSAPARATLTLAVESKTDAGLDVTNLDAAFEKMEMQIAALAETIKELRAAIKERSFNKSQGGQE